MKSRKLKQGLKSLTHLFHTTNYDKTIWLLGSGRSGTTWVSSIINYDNSYRELFEPFHTLFFEMRLSGFKKNLFLDEEISKKGVRVLSKLILSGKYYRSRTEINNKHITDYNNSFLIVKDIYANLIAHEISNKNEKIKPILLIRNPFAVTLSITEKKDWDWMKDPIEFLSQKKLVEDYLQPHVNLITKTSEQGSYFEKQILIWSIINYIPLKQFNTKLLVTFYEDWVLNPNQELHKVYNYLEADISPLDNIKNHPKFNNPSKTSSKKIFCISNWKNKLTNEEIECGHDILKHFGFEKLYDDNSRPNHKIIQEFLEK